MRDYKKMNKDTIVFVDAATISNYKGYCVFCKYYPSREKYKTLKVYMGKTDNYDNCGHYDNEDNSLLYITDNSHMYSFLSSSGYVLSQEEMKVRGFFTEEDYVEFQSLKDGFLKQFTPIKELMFNVDIMVDGSGTPFVYPNYVVHRTSNVDLLDKIYSKCQQSNQDCVVIMRVGDMCEIRGDNAKRYENLIGFRCKTNIKEKDAKIQFPLKDLNAVLNDLRKETRVVYQEISGDQEFVPSLKDMDEAVLNVEAKDGQNRSTETLEILRKRLFEFVMRQGPKWKGGKERIYDEALNCLNNEYSFDVFSDLLRSEYGECQLNIGDKSVDCKPDELSINMVDEIRPKEIVFNATWEEVAKITLNLVSTNNFFTEAEKMRYDHLKEEQNREVAKLKLLGEYEEEADSERKETELTEEEFVKLFNEEPKNFRKRVQKQVDDEYNAFKSKMLRESKTSIYEAALESNFYQIAYEVLMLPDNINPLDYDHYRALDTSDHILKDLYEFYISEEEDPIINGDNMAHLIKKYNRIYNGKVLNLGRNFKINEMKRNLPGDYTVVNVYYRTKKYAENHREEKMYYQSEELNNKCLKEINKIIQNQMQDNLANTLVKKYGYERVTEVLALSIKKLAPMRKKGLRPDTILWAKDIKTPGSTKSRLGNIDVPLEAFELFVDEVRNEEEKAYRKPLKQKDEKPKEVKWFEIKTDKETLIRKYEMHSFLQMPRNGEYGGYTYLLFNNRIKQDEDNPNGVIIKLAEDEKVILKNRNNVKIELEVKDFIKAIENKSKEDFLNPKEVFNVTMPKNALNSEYENSYLFDMPLNTTYTGKTYFIPKAFVSKNEDGSFKAQIPSDFIFAARGGGDLTSVEINAKEFASLIINNDTYRDKGVQESWCYMFVPTKARLSKYDNTSLFKAPNGSGYDGYIYYIPNKMVKEIEGKDVIRIALPTSFEVNMRKPDENKEEDILANKLMKILKSKDYESTFKKPSEYREGRFNEMENKLIENIPEEMKKRNNWVAVRTKFNEENGRFSKYLINVHNGKFAESDNPETWASFEEACKYAKENNADTVAYALDGEDNICCIDIDGCLDQDGAFTNKAAEKVHALSNGMYMERSISGGGLHFFGKTSGIPIRTFSKDGDIEFYQKSHFMAMTGDTDYKGELKNIDNSELEKYLKSKCEKRVEWKGEAEGLTGLSYMSDREVVDRACSSNGGETFEKLYNGEDLQKNHSNSDMSLMNRLAFWCNGDKEQMLRIFATSGLYRPNKSPDYYECTAIKAIKDCTSRYNKEGAREYIKNKEKEKSEIKDVKDLDEAFSK